MAFTSDITTNFIGEVAGDYIRKAIKQSNTIKDNLVTIYPDLTSNVYVRKIEVEEGFVDYSCGRNPQGSVILSEKLLAPKKIMWHPEFCLEDYRQLWTAAQMGFSAHNDDLPQTEKAAILMQMADIIARFIDVQIWEGDGTSGKFSGLIPAFLADADVIDVATPVAITSANVEAELGKFIDAIPDEVLNSPTYKMGVSTNVIRALRRIYGTQARTNGTFLSPNYAEFEGYTLTEIGGLNANTMVGYDTKQVFFGTGLLSDLNEVRLANTNETLLDGKVIGSVVMTGGVQYGFGGEIVLYRA